MEVSHGIWITRIVEILARLALLRFLRCEQQREYNHQDIHLRQLAERALQWMIDNLRDPENGLVWDSLVIKADKTHDINNMKWTYNAGFAIHGFALLYEATKKQKHLDAAVEISEAAKNRNGALCNKSIPDPQQRMYSEASFFLHHLVDGYEALAKHAFPDLRDRLRSEIRHIAQWGREWMYDPTDGIYFRGSCPYTISEGLTKRFNKKFQLQKSFGPNGQERDDKGKLCKTLIGNVSWVRIFLAEERL